MDGNNWDLFAVVRGCLAMPIKAAGDSISLPPVVAEDREPFGFTNIVAASASFCDEQLEEVCKPYYIEFERTLPKPQSQRKLQPLLPSKVASTSPSCVNNSLFQATMADPRQLQQQQSLPHRPPVSQAPRSKRRKSQLKKVVYQVPAADGVSSDMWAWRKYGQKPIKGSPYPRGYYRCSSSKGCQARKQVERSQADPGMLLITYTAEHNHPVPIHRSSLAGSTRQKFPPPKSSQVAKQTAASLSTSSALNPILGTFSSPVAAAILSPASLLVNSMEGHEILQLPQTMNKAHEKDQQEEEDDELLTPEDMEVMGGEDMIFLSMEVMRGPSAARSTGTSDTVSASGGFFMEDGRFDDQLIRSPWMSNSNAAAVADVR